MKALALCLALLSTATLSQAQKFISEKSKVTFFSKATIEDIAAHNEKSMGLFDPTTGDAAFSIPIVEFQFEKSLMKEHFNEKYMETEKYPKGTFQGKITGYTVGSTGAQTARAKGATHPPRCDEGDRCARDRGMEGRPHHAHGQIHGDAGRLQNQDPHFAF